MEEINIVTHFLANIKMSSQRPLKSSSSGIIIELTDETISNIMTQPTLLLYYDSTCPFASWMIHVMEQLSTLCAYEQYQVDFASIDAYTYPTVVLQYTDIIYHDWVSNQLVFHKCGIIFIGNGTHINCVTRQRYLMVVILNSISYCAFF